MAAAEPSRGDGGAVPTQSIGLCADLQSKLMLLGYEDEYCVPNDTSPFPPTYFAAPSASPGLQFQHFIGLASYLGDKAGVPGVGGDRYDDPNAAVNTLSSALHGVGFVADFAPIKLKAGWGEPVCRVLNFLSDRALKATKFSFQRPEYPDEVLPESGGATASADRVDDDDDDGEIDDDIEMVAQVEEEALYTEAAAGPTTGPEPEVPKPTVDRATWETEVERMAPRLRSQVAGSGREWRAHLEQTARHNATVSTLLSEAGRSLSSINADVSSALQRLQDKEKYINATLTSLLDEHRKARAKTTELEGEHEQRTTTVASLASEMGQVTDELDDAKARMDEHGSSMTDQSPLVRVKTALSKLRAEARALDLRIGVTGHGVMRRKLETAASQAAGGQDDEDGGGGGGDDDWVADDGGEVPVGNRSIRG